LSGSQLKAPDLHRDLAKAPALPPQNAKFHTPLPNNHRLSPRGRKKAASFKRGLSKFKFQPVSVYEFRQQADEKFGEFGLHRLDYQTLRALAKHRAKGSAPGLVGENQLPYPSSWVA